MWNSTWYGIKLLLAQVYQRSTSTRLPLEDGEGQQSPGLAPFQYSSLGASIHIKVLDILPGNHNSEIRFRLREKELGDGDVYHALSYAWVLLILRTKSTALKALFKSLRTYGKFSDAIAKQMNR